MLSKLAVAAGLFGAALAANTSYTVSGLSSGAFFAVQHGVIWSSEVAAIGVVAGGPYYCAQASLDKAEFECMNIDGTSIDVAELVTDTKEFATEGKIDPVSNLLDTKVYLYSGTRDTLVRSDVVKKAEEYFDDMVADSSQVVFKNDIDSEHAMVTNFYGSKCTYLGEPYINNCDFDLAGTMLQFFYGAMNQPVSPDDVPYDNVHEIDQKQFFAKDDDISLEDKAYIYVPSNCSFAPIEPPCQFHIAYHGCEQDLTSECLTCEHHTFNDTFVRKAGYNQWAETNDLVILYPQATSSSIHPKNPEGCWDWWGYDGKDYAFKTGAQMETMKSLLDWVLTGQK